MKKSVFLFVVVFLFSWSARGVAADGDIGEALMDAVEEAEQERQEEDMDEFMTGAANAAGSMPGLPGTIRLHVPVSVSGLPSEISTIGVRCTVSFPGYNAEGSVFGRARNGSRTMVVSIPLRNAMTNLHGSYECSLLIRVGNEQPVSSGNIQSIIELDPSVSPSQQVVVVQGSINRTPF